MYKEDLTSNNLQWLISNQTNLHSSNLVSLDPTVLNACESFSSFLSYFMESPNVISWL